MAEHPARRPQAAVLFVVAVAAAGLNLRTAITSVPPLFPDLTSQLRLSPAALSLLAATPVLCFGVVSAFAAWINRRFGEELVLLIALVLLAAGLLVRGLAPSAMLFGGTVLAAGSIAVLNVLLSSLVKRRWPERAGVLISVYLTALSVGAILASLLSVPLYRAAGNALGLPLAIWAAPAALAAALWLPQLRHRDVAPPGAARPASDAPRRPRGGPGSGARRGRPPPAGVPVPAGLAGHGLHGAAEPAVLRGPVLAADHLPGPGRHPGDRGQPAGPDGRGQPGRLPARPGARAPVPGQCSLIWPSVIGTVAGLAGCLWAPLGGAPAWVLVLGLSQGACLALAIFFMMARAPDPGTAASLSGFAQSLGYLAASAGPLAVGLLHTATGAGPSR